MAENLAQRIREEEEAAQKTVVDANAKAAEVIANAQAEAERSLKNARQQCHRQLRESTANADVEAEKRAAEILRRGELDAKAFYEQKKGQAEGVADWLVEEVIRTYGSGQDA